MSFLLPSLSRISDAAKTKETKRKEENVIIGPHGRELADSLMRRRLPAQKNLRVGFRTANLDFLDVIPPLTDLTLRANFPCTSF